MIEIIDIKLYHLHLFNVNNLLFTSDSYAVFPSDGSAGWRHCLARNLAILVVIWR